MSTYRMQWPIIDGRQVFADMLGTAVHDLTRALKPRGLRMAAPPDFTLPFIRGRRHLVAVVAVVPA